MVSVSPPTEILYPSTQIIYGFKANIDNSCWHDFLERYPDQDGVEDGQRLYQSDPDFDELLEVNLNVNATGYDLSDDLSKWDLISVPVCGFRPNHSDGMGTCADIALTKRAILWNMGWEKGALCPALVQVGYIDHMVLLVRTSEGEFVLDNYGSSIIPWDMIRCKWGAILLGNSWRGFMGSRPINK